MNNIDRKKLQKIDLSHWKKIQVEFGREELDIFVPGDCHILGMKEMTAVSDPEKAVEEALSAPVNSPTLEELIRRKGKRPEEISVAITVSDITRPVPYRGKGGILWPLLKRLHRAGIPAENIKLVVGTGMHRPSTRQEKIEMYGEEIVNGYRIVDHDCQDHSGLVYLGTTSRGTKVYVNAHFYRADLRIATGLVESHFFAGASGGRKAICPGLVDLQTIEKFHGPDFLENPRATNLCLEGNPCHEEALEVARTVGVDFIVNVNLDRQMRLIKVFAGEMVEAHLKAFETLREYAAVPLEEEYDIVLTHGGYVGVNHYQTAKAGVGALPAVKPNGILVIVANNRDPLDPVGSPEYRKLLALLKKEGPDGYLKMLRSPDWKFTKDQWEPEVWGKVWRKVGEKGLIYCSPQIDRNDFDLIPGIIGFEFLDETHGRSEAEIAREMTQMAVFYAVNSYLERGVNPSMAFIREGPYAVPLKVEERCPEP
ncbi:MAG: nickel-dependent lactate racemase [Candidatus Saccharicenans sp.]|nr:nickel-dependent lactate racemase [Candidatus Saccharicenans sp.]